MLGRCPLVVDCYWPNPQQSTTIHKVLVEPEHSQPMQVHDLSTVSILSCWYWKRHLQNLGKAVLITTQVVNRIVETTRNLIMPPVITSHGVVCARVDGRDAVCCLLSTIDHLKTSIDDWLRLIKYQSCQVWWEPVRFVVLLSTFNFQLYSNHIIAKKDFKK